MKISSILAGVLLVVACQNAPSQAPKEPTALLTPVQTQPQNGLHKAYFASGCFWCVEAIFESVKGVDEVISGYSGGVEENPTYKEVSYGRSTHAEAVEVYYNPDIVSFKTLVTVFFGSHDPTTLNRQGPDRGRQYRSIAFYQNDKEKAIIDNAIKKLNEAVYEGRIVTQVLPFTKFWKGEGYHQDYEANNPRNPYIQNVSVPRLRRFQKKFPKLLKNNAH